MEINERLSGECVTALSKYFEYYAETGYVRRDSVSEMLAMLFIDELLNEDNLNLFITDKDVNDLRLALTRIYGKSCFIDWPMYTDRWPELGNTIVKTEGRRPVRGTSKHLRFTQNGKMRVADEDTVHYWGLEAVYNGSNDASSETSSEEESDDSE